MLAASERNTGAAGLGVNQHTSKEVRSSSTTAPTLSSAGISKDLSARAQKLAAVPQEQFESEVSQWRERVSAEGARPMRALWDILGDWPMPKIKKP